MCCTADLSTLSDTIIYAGHQTREDQRVQVLAYQNKAKSTGPNAMILPIPTDVSMGPDNLVDTREGGAFLGILAEALAPQYRRLSDDSLVGAASMNFGAQVVEVGSYTIVLAERLSQVREALERVPENKRPEFSSEFLVGYGKLYPDHRFVICCWEGELKAEPVMLWFVPRDERLFIPTMDAHDGGAPKPGWVSTDHAIIVGVEQHGTAIKNIRLDTTDTIMALLAPQAQRHDVAWHSPNGDTWFEDGVLHRVTLQ
jgi:hypothetical protein